MRLVFLGSPGFALPSLEAVLAAGHEVALVVSQPDRPRGRGRRARPTPVRARALEAGLPTAAYERSSRDDVVQRILQASPEIVVVVAFGHILRPPLLDTPRHGCVNVHASLLPRWRGAAPVQRALLAGDTRTGVTTMRLTKGLDEGPVYLQRATAIDPLETAGELQDRLARLGADLLVATLEGLAAGTLEAKPQAETGVTIAPPLRREEGSVDFARPAQEVHNRIRGLDPWPGVTVLHGKERLKLAGSRGPQPRRQAAAPGTVLARDEAGLVVACGEGAVLVTRVQRAGGRWMSPEAYAAGHPLAAGDMLGSLLPPAALP